MRLSTECTDLLSAARSLTAGPVTLRAQGDELTLGGKTLRAMVAAAGAVTVDSATLARTLRALPKWTLHLRDEGSELLLTTDLGDRMTVPLITTAAAPASPAAPPPAAPPQSTQAPAVAPPPKASSERTQLLETCHSVAATLTQMHDGRAWTVRPDGEGAIVAGPEGEVLHARLGNGKLVLDAGYPDELRAYLPRDGQKSHLNAAITRSLTSLCNDITGRLLPALRYNLTVARERKALAEVPAPAARPAAPPAQADTAQDPAREDLENELVDVKGTLDETRQALKLAEGRIAELEAEAEKTHQAQDAEQQAADDELVAMVSDLAGRSLDNGAQAREWLREAAQRKLWADIQALRTPAAPAPAAQDPEGARLRARVVELEGTSLVQVMAQRDALRVRVVELEATVAEADVARQQVISITAERDALQDEGGRLRARVAELEARPAPRTLEERVADLEARVLKGTTAQPAPAADAPVEGVERKGKPRLISVPLPWAPPPVGTTAAQLDVPAAALKSLKCWAPGCGKKCETEKKLRNHFAWFHVPKQTERPHQCPLCLRKCEDAQDLARHSYAVHPEAHQRDGAGEFARVA